MFVASPEQRRAYARQCAKVRGNHFGDEAHIPLSACVSAAMHQRFLSAVELAPQKASICGVCITDLEQRQDLVCLGPYVPPLVKHGRLVNVGTQELMMPQERLCLMGEPCFGDIQPEDYPSYMWETSKGWISANIINRWSGNAFHMANMGVVVMYAMSCLRVRLSAEGADA